MNIQFTQLDKFIGININNSILKKNAILLLCIDNITLYEEYSLICHNIPRIIENNKENINYNKIVYFYSYPIIDNKIINKDYKYLEISKIIKSKCINTNNIHINDYLENIIKYYNIINNSNVLINCLFISKANNINLNDNILLKLRYLNKNTNFTYYDFNNLNNITFYDVDNMNYINNKLNNITFINFIKNYSLDLDYNFKEIVLELNLEGANYFGNKSLKLFGITNYLLIEKDKDFNQINIIIRYDKEYILNDIEKNIKNDNNVYDYIKFIEHTLYYIQENNINNSFYYLNIFKNIIKDINKIALKNNNIELSKNLIWIKNYLYYLSNKYLKNLKNNNNNIFELVIKSNNNVETYKFKNIMNEIIINNFNDLNKLDQIFSIDNDLNKYIEELENSNNLEFIKSCETFNSVISISNWFDELKNGSSMGFMIKLYSNNNNKLAISGYRVIIDDITMSFISSKDYIDSVIHYFDNNLSENNLEDNNLNNNNLNNNNLNNNNLNNNNLEDNYLNNNNLNDNIKNNNFGNLNDVEIFRGESVSSNAVIPLYINKYHWKQVKKHIYYIYGIILAHHPLGYNKNHLDFSFYLLSNMTIKTFINHKSILWIKLYFAFFRTCSEIAYEKNYHKGIKKLINNYINNPYERLKSRPFDIDSILGQILCTGLKLESNKLYKLVDYMMESCIRLTILDLYKDDNYMEFLLNLENKEDLYEEIDYLINNINKQLIYIIKLLLFFLKMYKIIQDLILEFGGFKKFIHHLDNNYGLLDEKYCLKVFEKIKLYKMDDVIYDDLFKEIGINNGKSKILFYILQSLKYCKNKQMRYAIKNNKLLEFNESMTIDNIISIYKENLKI